MRYFIDGFDQFVGTMNASADMTRAGYSLATSPSISTNPATNTGRIMIPNGWISRTHDWLENTFTAGINSSFSERGSQLWIEFADETKLVCWTNPDNGAPHLNATAGGSLPIKDTPYYFEIELDRAALIAKLYINGRYELSTAITTSQAFTDEVTVSFGVLPVDEYNPGGRPVAGTRTVLDFYMYDGSRFGPIRVTTRFPSATVANSWLLAGGASAHEILKTLPPEPLDKFIATETVGDSTNLTSDKMLPTANPIVGTGIVVLVRKSADVDVGLLGFMGDDISAASRSSVIELSSDWQLRYATFNPSPSDNKLGIEAAPFGLIVTNP